MGARLVRAETPGDSLEGETHVADSFPELKPAARILLGPGPSNVNPRVMKAMAVAGRWSSRSGFREGDGEYQAAAAHRLPHQERDHVSRLRHRFRGDGSRDGESDRRRRRGRGRRQRRVRNAAGGSCVATRRKGSQGRGGLGNDRGTGASRGGAEGGERSEAGRDRSRRDFDRDTSADRGNRRAGASTRRDDGDRRGDIARVRAGRD